ncbi:hypothetical protein EV360DRAFT_89206 [Lentinula raphanica]|nr:hypothetical protein EV360DRAFT_89206 [Lentinula raphanica]
MTDGVNPSSTPAPIQIPAQDLESLDGIIQQYSSGSLSKTDTIIKVTVHLTTVCDRLKLKFDDSILRPYMDEIEGAERERDRAKNRGDRQPRGNNGAGDDGLGEENAGGGGDDDDDEEEETANANAKRRRVNSSTFHWNQGANLILSATLTAAHEQVRRQVENYSLDLKNALQSLEVAIAKPSLPKGQWKNILLDGYVDFDDLLGNLFTSELEETSLYLNGDTTLEFRRPRTVTKVNTHGQWINAFRVYEEAVNFAFPGRQPELQVYWNHIHYLFAALQPVLHHRVINYDRAVRIFVGSRRDILLNEANLPKTNENTLPRSVAIGTSVPAMREPASSVTHAFSASPPNMLDPSVRIEITSHLNHPKPLSKFAEFSHARMVLEDDDGEDDKQGVGVEARGRFLPRFARGLGWRLGEKAHGSRTIAYTEVDDPLPRPPPCEYDTVAMETIQNNPDLFHVPQVISTERLEALLTRHPNRLFVKSVITGLREGFWPWALTNPDNAHYPETWDNSFAPPHTVDEQTFINTQRDTEQDKHRFSHSFGPDLLPGMYSTPVIAVPKPRSSDLRLVSNQSAGEFSQNSMVDPVAIKGPRMDTMKEFIPALLRYRRENPHQKLVMWKSDVSEAYRLVPMHPLWQIKQVVTSNLPTKDEVKEGQRVDEIKRSVDWCATFGNRASPRLWFSVIGLVLWIAMYVKLIIDIFCYVDDVYGWEKEDNLMLYKPFNVRIPVKQAQLLYLWDFLGIPHKLKKLLNGPSLPIIGFDVDPNAMTITLPEESKQELILSVREFISTPSRRRSLHEFQMLAGWINWSLNVFPLLRPGLCNVYEKMRGKAKPNALIYLNEAVKRDLNWFIYHVERSSGTYLFDGMDWNPSTECNMTIYCNACLTGMGYWIPELLLGFYSPIPVERSAHPIFFFEALAVLSALVWYGSSMRSDSSLSGRLRLVIFTDNTNTVDIFDSLSARPDYNFILQAAVDELIFMTFHLYKNYLAPNMVRVLYPPKFPIKGGLQKSVLLRVFAVR